MDPYFERVQFRINFNKRRFCYNQRMANSKLIQKNAPVGTETIEDQVRRAVANIALEGVRPSMAWVKLARQFTSGKLSGNEAILMLSK